MFPSVGSMMPVRKRKPQTRQVLTTFSGHRGAKKSLVCVCIAPASGLARPATYPGGM